MKNLLRRRSIHIEKILKQPRVFRNFVGIYANLCECNFLKFSTYFQKYQNTVMHKSLQKKNREIDIPFEFRTLHCVTVRGNLTNSLVQTYILCALNC